MEIFQQISLKRQNQDCTEGAGYKTLHKIAVRPFWGQNLKKERSYNQPPLIGPPVDSRLFEKIFHQQNLLKKINEYS